ncbi:MAG TPA: thiamine diphosphokinase [Candidatus Anaerotignum merdipullorum]|nr:thiamine diphosphokinase [Candidatus Anaerotignum merdipullorum]
MKAVLFAGADIGDYTFCHAYLQDADIIICCDGGVRHTKALGIQPQYIVGDFDSAPPEILEEYRRQGIVMRQVPTHKNETDMQLGMLLALELGATELILLGGIGDRLDHTLANAHLLLYLLKQGVKAVLVNEKNRVELIDHATTLHGKAGDLVSIIPLSMVVRGVTLEGLEYPLVHYDLAMDDALIAVSNVMLSDTATVTIADGYLFVMQTRD